MTVLETNVWLRHGSQGMLMQRLARYSVLGWVLFVCAAIAFAVLAVLTAWRTPPIIAVNRDGALLGRMQWLGRAHRSRAEIVAASMRFVRDYLSVNRDTVVPDYVQALNMMAPRLRQATVKALQKSAYIDRVRSAHIRSWVSFDKGHKRPRVVSVSKGVSRVRLSGVIHLVFPSGPSRRQGFTVVLTVSPVPRRRYDTAGLVVRDVRGL